jgi:putative ribosome biogenesis GTPase RsgA
VEKLFWTGNNLLFHVKLNCFYSFFLIINEIANFASNYFNLKKGLVIKSTGSWYTVEDENGELFECKIKGNFRIKDIRSTNPIAVGDHVEFSTQHSSGNKKSDNIGLISAISERKNYIIRKSPNLSKESHIIAANIDQAILVITLISLLQQPHLLIVTSHLLKLTAFRLFWYSTKLIVITLNKRNIYKTS